MSSEGVIGHNLRAKAGLDALEAVSVGGDGGRRSPEHLAQLIGCDAFGSLAYRCCGLGVLSNLPFFLFKDPGSVLKGGVKVCQRQPVEVPGPPITEFVRNFGREDATPYQRGS